MVVLFKELTMPLPGPADEQYLYYGQAWLIYYKKFNQL